MENLLRSMFRKKRLAGADAVDAIPRVPEAFDLLPANSTEFTYRHKIQPIWVSNGVRPAGSMEVDDLQRCREFDPNFHRCFQLMRWRPLLQE